MATTTGQDANDGIVYIQYSPSPQYDALAIIQNGEITSKYTNFMDITISNGKIMVWNKATSSTQLVNVMIFN